MTASMTGLLFLLFTLSMGGPMGATGETVITVPPAQVIEMPSQRVLTSTQGELRVAVQSGTKTIVVQQGNPTTQQSGRSGLGATGIVVITLALLMFGGE